MSDRETSPAPTPVSTLTSWPTYALRGWLAALLTQTLQIETQIKHRIEDIETEAQRLRAQLDRATPVIESLQQSIRRVDDALRRMRDVDLVAASARNARPARPETSDPETVTRPDTSQKAEQKKEEPPQKADAPPEPSGRGRQRKR
jgi:hypothetical protein